MNKIAFGVALIASGGVTAGCATVSVGAVAGGAAQQVEAASATPEQLQLRAASAAFTDHAASAGWVDAAASDGAARQALDVLLHGLDAASADDEAAVRPEDAFIQARGYGAADPAEVTASLASEIREARIRVRAVNTAAATVVLGPERASWSRREDVRAAETVVQAARRTRRIFRDVSDVVGERLDSGDRAVLDYELTALDLELERLSEAADALSMARPDVEVEQVDVIGPSAGVG